MDWLEVIGCIIGAIGGTISGIRKLDMSVFERNNQIEEG